MTTQSQQRALRRSIIKLATSVALFALLLFLPAGTLGWTLGWIFIGAFVAMVAVAIPIVWRRNPEIFVVRQSFHPGTAGWDRILAPTLIATYLLILPIAGLDYRNNWAQAPIGLVITGYVVLALSLAAQIWPLVTNPHFEPGVRIQSDRNHRVIDTGPYAFVRHPGYVAASLMAVALPLCLGSLVALIPALITIGLLILRTNAEDRLLQRELHGYAAYAQRVPFKWIPGVW